MEEKIIQLDERDLDSIVGGAFNQSAVNKYGLTVLTGKSGAQGLQVEMTYTEGSAGSGSIIQKTGPMSEGTLKRYVEGTGSLTLKVKTNSGEMRALTQSQAKELFA